MSKEAGMDGKIEEGEIREGYGLDASSEGQDTDHKTDGSLQEEQLKGNLEGSEDVSEKLNAMVQKEI